jgi:uncharacterized membrane protein YfcA
VTVAEALALAAAGVAAGVISTVVGLASVVSYPALLAIGLPPLAANMTNTVALLFTGVGAAAGSRPELAGQATRARHLGTIAALGGGAGAAPAAGHAAADVRAGHPGPDRGRLPGPAHPVTAGPGTPPRHRAGP